MKGLILGATIGDCVHAAGLLSFLRLAEAEGDRAGRVDDDAGRPGLQLGQRLLADGT